MDIYGESQISRGVEQRVFYKEIIHRHTDMHAVNILSSTDIHVYIQANR